MVTKVGTDDEADLHVETSSNDSNRVFRKAKTMFGLGPGSKYDPIKASVIMSNSDDDEDEEEDDEKIDIDLLDGMTNEEIISEGPEKVREVVKNIVEELDEIIDIDREQKELNLMFMDDKNEKL